MTQGENQAGVVTRYCRRCDQDRRVTMPQRGWRVLYRVWQALCVIFLFGAPMFAADMMIAYPLAAVVVVGGIPLKQLADELPRCRYCKLHLPDLDARPSRWQRLRRRFSNDGAS